MFLCDVNIYLHAFRTDQSPHRTVRRWFLKQAEGPAGLAHSEFVFSSFLRIVSHPRVYKTPTPMREALAFLDVIRSFPSTLLVSPGERHWEIFRSLLARHRVSGNLVPDAYLAALALEHGCTWVTTDGDFSRFKGLEVLNPIDGV